MGNRKSQCLELADIKPIHFMTKKQKAVVLLSGGLDSATSLYWAIKKGFEPFALIFDYGQRHLREIKSAKKIAVCAKADFEVIKLNLPWLKKSSLIDKNKKLPDLKLSEITCGKIPSTYVPARNLMMLSIAAGWVDVLNAKAVVTGVNSVDYSGYPDCRPNFIGLFEKTANLGSTSKNLRILTPLSKLTKARIVTLAVKLGVPMQLTWSCYAGGRNPCGKCDSCKLRTEGFKKAGLKDPLVK